MKTGIRLSADARTIRALEAINYSPSPVWLGAFRFRMWSWIAIGQNRFALGQGRGKPAPEVWALAAHMAAAHGGPQVWNTLFVQRYEPGQNVKPHRDPRNNVGETLIGLCGDFTPTVLRVRDQWLRQEPGDVFVLPCTNAGVQGPEHEMQWMPGSTGIRYAVILNTINR